MMSDNDKAMTTRDSVPMTARGLEPQNFEQAWRMAQVLAASDLVPKDYKGRPENCLVAIQMGRELGVSAMQALQGIAVINGRPTIWGDLGLALIQAHPDFQDIEEGFEGEGERLTAVCTIKRRGRSPVTRRFGVEDAKAASLWGKQGPWQQYKRRMLQMRARWWASRDSFADALKGIFAAEEAVDLPPVEVPGATALSLAATLSEREAIPETTGEAIPKEEEPQPPATPDAKAEPKKPREKPLPGRSTIGQAIEKQFHQAGDDAAIKTAWAAWSAADEAKKLTEDDNLAIQVAMEQAKERISAGGAA
jgi:hypothetical protein